MRKSHIPVDGRLDRGGRPPLHHLAGTPQHCHLGLGRFSPQARALASATLARAAVDDAADIAGIILEALSWSKSVLLFKIPTLLSTCVLIARWGFCYNGSPKRGVPVGPHLVEKLPKCRWSASTTRLQSRCGFCSPVPFRVPISGWALRVAELAVVTPGSGARRRSRVGRLQTHQG